MIPTRILVLLSKEFEREMDKVLANGDLDDITEMITAHKLTKCKTNSLEKALEVLTQASLFLSPLVSTLGMF